MRGPIVHQGPLTLGHYADLTGMGTRSLVHFTREIAWHLRTETRLSYLHGGHELKRGLTTCDAGGVGRSIDHAVEIATEAAATYEIGPQSSLPLVARTRAELVPLIPDPRTGSRLVDIPDGWVRIDDAGRDDGRLTPHPVLTDTLVWSSQNRRADNDALAADARRIIETLALTGNPR